MQLSDSAIWTLAAIEELVKEGKLNPDILLPPKEIKNKTSFSDDFTLTHEMNTWFYKQDFGLDIRQATEQWIDAMRSNRSKYQYTDWEAAWRNGMRNNAKWKQGLDYSEPTDVPGVIEEMFKSDIRQDIKEYKEEMQDGLDAC